MVLMTGGRPEGMSCSVAAVMAEVAAQAGVPASAIILETASRTTWENAHFSAPLLQARGVHRILLVTDKLHMPRTEASFARFAFRIERASVPAHRKMLEEAIKSLDSELERLGE